MSKPHRITWDKRASVAANARRALPPCAAAYFAGVRETLAADPLPPVLHRARLETKRLRYTLELFRPCYGPGFETRLAALQGIQQLLGDVSDAVSAVRMLPATVRAHAIIERRAEAKALEFRKHWTEVFDAPGQERLWIRYLSRPVER
jgi:CHAD domain-containing protein